MMNQCDGCKAGVETYVKDGITWHVMGTFGPGGRYRDLMICERERYEKDWCGGDGKCETRCAGCARL